jgi:predicted Zn-dependent protease
LNKVSAAMASYDAKNFVAQNNLAATSLLLKLNLPKTHELAKEVYLQHPEEAIVTATYAYSLHLQGRTREGLAAIEKLKPDALEIPSVALYYAVLLAAVGETNKGSKYLEIAQGANLLPEEKALIAAAKGL